jgi:hypothetical protein
VLCALRVHRDHPLDNDAIRYHRERFVGVW